MAKKSGPRPGSQGENDWGPLFQSNSAPPAVSAATIIPTHTASSRLQGSENAYEPKAAPSAAEGQTPANVNYQESKNTGKKLRRQQEQPKRKETSQLEYRESTNRTLIEVSPESIDIDSSYLRMLTRKFVGLFDIELPILTEEGAKRVADLLRVHVVIRKNKLVCIAGYIPLKVISGLAKPPKTIIAELHNCRLKDDDIEKWALAEFQCIPPLFWLRKQEEKRSQAQTNDDYNLFCQAAPRRTRTRRDDEFYQLFRETCDSPTGKQLIYRPENDSELAKVLRLSERTITNRARNAK